ncbi:GNAT family N-acetyltransferase [Salisediminibacterium selenitireducens]|uniref:GNAT family N-acetyltransferase n=1 Tax=Salisediminibacterium selenitireducens TaxID=85683 RepID=UPI00015F9988|nr:GNAT family N-acetyltransferase [Salisediminibacterium selenitireducens]
MNEEHLFLGAYEAGVCIGLAVLKHSWFQYMYVMDLKVSRAYRNQGAAQALIEKARGIARDHQYRGLYTIGQDNNLAACRFYLKNGFLIGGFDNRSYDGTAQEGKADITFYLDDASNTDT